MYRLLNFTAVGIVLLAYAFAIPQDVDNRPQEEDANSRYYNGKYTMVIYTRFATHIPKYIFCSILPFILQTIKLGLNNQIGNNGGYWSGWSSWSNNGYYPSNGGYYPSNGGYNPGSNGGYYSGMQCTFIIYISYMFSSYALFLMQMLLLM